MTIATQHKVDNVNVQKTVSRDYNLDNGKSNHVDL